MKKWSLLMAFVLVLSSILGACGSKSNTASGGTKNVKQEMTVNAMTEPPSLDPALATDTTSGWILDHIFEGLYTRDKKGNVVKGVAKSVKKSDGGKTYTFTLRDDAKWSDGSKVTAQDFEYAWKHVLDPSTASSFAFYMYYIKGAEDYNKGKGSVDNVGVKALDDKTLQVQLTAPLGYFDKLLTMWTFYPVKKDLAEKNKNWAASPAQYVSDGPFKLSDWKHNSQVVITKNNQYYDKNAVSLKKVTFKMVNDGTTYYQMYKTGDLDMIMNVPTDVINSVKNSKDYKQTSFFGTYMYMFNVKKAPFTNAKIRKAFAMAIDRKAITKNVTQAGETPAYAMVPPGAKTDKGDFRKTGGNYVKENVQEAKKLLKEGMKEEGWKTLPQVTLIYNTDDNHKKIAEAVQEMYKKNLGIDIKISNQEWKTYLDTTKQGNYQMARMGWIGIFVDPTVILDFYLGDSPNNETGWKNSKFDSLIARAKVEQNESKRYELLHQAEKVLMTDMPFMPVYFYTNTYMVSPKYKDVVYYVNRYPYLKWAKKTAE
ncbi:peptide ABC transporter substrate-binding protein [Heyndrickxia coagulans]|uniref:peptide ABC transporter substrate-binding protein n=1 Tax=Heyndrickxia coagulans TaxID=1398 RepID=UPI0022356082|nr:peptide ABC transporter substrate-binding protein [Heyndrickxia coagulans]UZH06079.1 peptide ABC transporter substrate-binding protein [Heyndrickxia coagulans]